MYRIVWNADLHFYASVIFYYFSVPILFIVMILCKHLQMGRMFSGASSMYGFDLYFCFIDFMIRFTDFMLFLCSYIV